MVEPCGAEAGVRARADLPDDCLGVLGAGGPIEAGGSVSREGAGVGRVGLRVRGGAGRAIGRAAKTFVSARREVMGSKGVVMMVGK